MKSARSLGLLVLVACNCVLVAAEPEKKAPSKFPARLEVVSSKRLDDGRRELDLKIILEKNVEVYGKFDGQTSFELPLAKITLVTPAGEQVPVTVVFPKPNVVQDDDVFDKIYYYSESIRFQATYTPPDNREELKLLCKLGGWNRQQSRCLGFHRVVQAAIPADDAR